MKNKILILVTLLTSINTSAQTLFNKDGILLNYNRVVKLSEYCNKEKKQINYIIYRLTVTNNSGKTARIIMNANIPDPITSNSARADCFSEDVVFRNTNLSDNYFEKITHPDDQEFMEVRGWYFNNMSDLPGFNISYKFATVPVKTVPAITQKTIVKNTPTKTTGTTNLYQNDLIVNPVNKQKEQYDLTIIKNQDDALKTQAKQSLAAQQQNKLDLQNKTQQQQKVQSQQQEAAQAKLNQLQQQVIVQQQRYQQTQVELDNAKNVSINAYQAAINSGRKESGAMLDATLAGANEISDAKSALVYTGVGLGLSLISHLGEKKAERLSNEAALLRETVRKEKIIAVKGQYIKDVLAINQYQFSELISKDRYSVVLLTPKNINAGEQPIYFSTLVKVPMYDDDTFPLKDNILGKILSCIDKSILSETKVEVLYPIMNFEKFQDEFIKKMGSGYLINLNAKLLNFTKIPFIENSNPDKGKNFKNNESLDTKDTKKTKKESTFWEKNK